MLWQPFVFVGSDKEWRAADQLVSSVINLKVENISDIMVTKTEENGWTDEQVYNTEVAFYPAEWSSQLNQFKSCQ